MPGTGLMRYVTHDSRLRDETAHKGLYIRQITSAVVAHVNYQSLCVFEEIEDIIEVPLADWIRERGIVDIPDVVLENTEKHSGTLAIVEVEI